MTRVFQVWRGLLIVALSLSLAKGSDAIGTTEAKPDALGVGEALPMLEATDDAGQPWKSAEHAGQRVLVMYFYPGDFTGGCSRQAQAFREGLKRLEDLDVEVVGISGDEVATHKLFKESHGLTHTLLADPEGALAERLGIPVQRPAKPAKVRTSDLDGKPLMDEKGKSVFVERKLNYPRWTLIVGRDGTLLSKRTKINPATDAEEVIALIEGLKRER